MGIIVYMVFEVLRGEITFKFDIYSFGVVSFMFIISNNGRFGYNFEIEVEYLEYIYFV